MAPLRTKGAALTFLLLQSLFLFLALEGTTSALATVPSRHDSRGYMARKGQGKPHSAARARRATVQEDMTIVNQRRVSTIIGGLTSVRSIPTWLSTLDADGRWPESEIDYTTGCEARRASWPARTHWTRLVTMAGAWHGGAPNTAQWVNNTGLRDATSLAMAYWIDRDIGGNIACLDKGGTPDCPCENPDGTFWNTNWFSNIILIPELVAHVCLLLGDSLTPTEATFCGNVTTRAYGVFERGIKGVRQITAANTIDIAKISVDAGLLTNNAEIVTDAFRRMHAEMKIVNEVMADGIRADGAFSQQKGILYNGNYGKDYSNALIALEVAAGGTQFQASESSRNALEVLIKGNKWMVFANTLTNVLHWDYSTLARMISFPVADNQATANLKTNLTTVMELGTLWPSNVLQDFVDDLSMEALTANAGNLVGNKMFFTNDYMVHRAPGYVSTLNMYSTRTTGPQCINDQNRKGFHLADGTLFNYQRGDEYEDIFASWDWDLIPGTTVDYQNSPLTCATTTQVGLESYVGGLSDGRSGVSAMRYTNPLNQALKWQKTWFFLESGVYHVMVNILASTSSAPVYSVLDQKRKLGVTQVNGALVVDSTTSHRNPTSIWHDNVGYTFPPSIAATLNLRTGPATGSWADIGTSTRPATTVDLWAAWLEHTSLTTPIEYSMWPGRSHSEFQISTQDSPVVTIENSQAISAIHDVEANRIMGVYWDTAGGSFTREFDGDLAPLTISSDSAVAITISLEDGTIMASDPSQTLASAILTFEFGATGTVPRFWSGGRSKTVSVTFPAGGLAGKTVQSTVRDA